MTETKIAVHPFVSDDDMRDGGDHDGCTEGLSDEHCDEVCTDHNKALGICKCRRDD